MGIHAQAKEIPEVTRKVVNTSLDDGLVVASPEYGCEPWQEPALCDECDCRKDREVERWQPGDKQGVIL